MTLSSRPNLHTALLAPVRQAAVRQLGDSSPSLAPFDELSDAVVACDAQGTLIYMNRVAQRRYGALPVGFSVDAIARYCHVYRADEPTVAHVNAFHQVLQGETLSGETHIVALQGKERHGVQVYGYRLKNAKGEVAGALLVLKRIEGASDASKLAAKQTVSTNFTNLLPSQALLATELLGEGERLSIARDLHDGALQEMITLSYTIAELERELGREHRSLATSAAWMREQLFALRHDVNRTIKRVRSFITGLRPVTLEDGRLVRSLETYVARLKHDSRQTLPDIKMTLEPQLDTLTFPQMLCLFRTAQEGLRNALSHADASVITLEGRCYPTFAVVTVEDNGKGFEVPEALSHFARLQHFGLLGMAERALLLGGGLQLVSSPGQGTTLRVQLPIGDTSQQSMHENAFSLAPEKQAETFAVSSRNLEGHSNASSCVETEQDI